MWQQILDKILNESQNFQIQEILNVVKENDIFKEVLSDIKEQYFIKDKIHGLAHNIRVVLFACYIGMKEGLSQEELKLTLNAALYHDIGRGYLEKRGNHGSLSAGILGINQGYILPKFNEDEVKIIKALCHAHSVNDDKIVEIANDYGVTNLEKFQKMIAVVKDADALDRVRLNKSYLRTLTSQKMAEITEEFFNEFEQIRSELPEKAEPKIESRYVTSESLRNQLLFDGEYYYLVRSLNKNDKDILDKVDGADTLGDVVRIINGADRQVDTKLVEKEYQYLTEEEQLKQAKIIAKCKVLSYYGLMRNVFESEEEDFDITKFSTIMRNGYSSSEWLYFGKIEQERIINAPKLIIDALLLVRQARFQGDNEELKRIEEKLPDIDVEISARILQSVTEMLNDILENIVLNGVESTELEQILIKTRTKENRNALVSKYVSNKTKYMGEAIVEGYNWRESGNCLTKTR